MDSDKILGIGSRVKHPAYGEGVIIRLYPIAYDVCFMHYGIKSVGKEYNAWEIVERIEPEELVTFTQAEKSLVKILKQWSDISSVTEIGDKWDQGNLILKPSDANLKTKELPIETFFHKIVMLRDRLRVLEQKINGHSKLTDSEKVEMQQYITRIYGSLTTFNVLFKYKEDYFVGEKSES
ncbi:MAG: hypothetical protein KA143_02190 [Saprospiraceae bacterium]|nr:hypothetical protein [Saprospiraceae bacterium]